jgi:hypothetical protein
MTPLDLLDPFKKSAENTSKEKNSLPIHMENYDVCDI